MTERPTTLTPEESDHLLANLADVVHTARTHNGGPCDGDNDGCGGGPDRIELEAGETALAYVLGALNMREAAENDEQQPPTATADSAAAALVCAMHQDADCPVVIGNGSYQHASLLAEHLAAAVDAYARAAIVKAMDDLATVGAGPDFERVVRSRADAFRRGERSP